MIAERRDNHGAGSALVSADSPAARRRQVRRAWLALATASLLFMLLVTGAGGAGYWYRGHATTKKTALVEVIQGDRASIRTAYQLVGRTVTSGTIVHEGDVLQTLEGTSVILTLWDDSRVQLFEGTEAQITEMRTTQYINRASAFSMTLTRGLVRVAVAPSDYSRSRFDVKAGDTTVLMKEGGNRTGGGSFLVEVKPDADGQIASVRASVRRGVGAVRVAGRDGEVRLGANEQTIVPARGAPGPPTMTRRDLVANGQFASSGAKTRNNENDDFDRWGDISTPGQTGSYGRLRAVQETVNGQPVSALEIFRSPDSLDPAITGLRQPLGVTVADLVSLELTADIKLLEQNVLGGGVAGTEFPMIVRVNYRDATGASQVAVWGFYFKPNPPAQPTNGRQVTPGEWYPLRVDLRGLAAQPVRLDYIEVYASGHGYRARITNVAIIGTE